MTAHGPSEISIVRKIVAKLNAMPETYARKSHGSAYSSGWPDILGAHRGRPLALEVKRPGGKATPLQLRELSRWREAGAIVGVVTSWEQVERFLEQRLDESR